MLHQSARTFAFIAGVVLALANTTIIAADYFWTAGSGNWNSTGWSNTADGAPTLPPPPGGPNDRNNFFLYNSGPTDVTVTVTDGVVSPFGISDPVTINATGTGQMTLSIEGGNFGAGSLSVGTSGTGTINQSSGYTGSFGTIIGNSGTYNLSGGNLSLDGFAVYGTFNQTGGNANYFSFGLRETGTYNLSAGFISTSVSHRINGTFNQTGGTLQGSFGEINGTFNQTGGSYSVATILAIANGGTYNLSGGSFAGSSTNISGTLNQSGGTLGNFNFNVGPNGVYNLSGGSSLSGGGLSLDGTVNQTGGSHTSGEGMIVNASGTYNLSGGTVTAGSATVDGTFNQTGGLNRGATTYRVFAIGPDGTYNLQGGTFSGDIISNNGAFNFSGGTLSFDTFNGNLVNKGGTLAPGSSLGEANIVGNYTQSRSGTYAVEIGGLAQGTEYDTLSVGSTAYLNGLLSVSFLDLGTGLFSPQFGDFFDVLSADQIFGGFGSFSLPDLARNEAWRIAYLADAFGTRDVVRLSVAPVPEPEIYVLMLAGLALLGFVTHKKQRESNLAAA